MHKLVSILIGDLKSFPWIPWWFFQQVRYVEVNYPTPRLLVWLFPLFVHMDHRLVFTKQRPYWLWVCGVGQHFWVTTKNNYTRSLVDHFWHGCRALSLHEGMMRKVTRFSSLLGVRIPEVSRTLWLQVFRDSRLGMFISAINTCFLLISCESKGIPPMPIAAGLIKGSLITIIP